MRKKESWNILEFGGSVRNKKRKEVKKERCRGTCVEEKKKEKKEESNAVRVWRIKKEGKKKEKKRKKRKWYHNIFIILS